MKFEKKLLTLTIIFVLAFSYIPNLAFAGNETIITPPTPTPEESLEAFLAEISPEYIRSGLVNFIIQPQEYTQSFTFPAGAVNRWQFLELDTLLDLSNFTATTEQISFDVYTFGSQPGDAFLVTFHWREYPVLIVDLGDGAFHVEWLHGHIGLTPQESVDVRERLQRMARKQNLARFNMSRQYTSDNFYWYSNNTRSRWLPAMAKELERGLPELLDEMDITLTQKIQILYYDRRHFITAYPEFAASHPQAYVGHAGQGQAISAARPAGSTNVSEMMTGHLRHEFVHVLQAVYFPPDWEAMNQLGLEWLGWVNEGTATYLGHGREIFAPVVKQHFQRRRLPTLESLSNGDNFFAHGGWVNYCWAATVFEFIHQEYGMEYVMEMNRRHGDFQGIFGLSRNEFQRRWHTWLRVNYG
jgi:hypothetical protein